MFEAITSTFMEMREEERKRSIFPEGSAFFLVQEILKMRAPAQRELSALFEKLWKY